MQSFMLLGFGALLRELVAAWARFCHAALNCLATSRQLNCRANSWCTVDFLQVLAYTRACLAAISGPVAAEQEVRGERWSKACVAAVQKCA